MRRANVSTAFVFCIVAIVINGRVARSQAEEDEEEVEANPCKNNPCQNGICLRGGGVGESRYN